MKNTTKVILLVLIVLVLDQLSKIYIKTNFSYGQTYDIFSWAKLHFVENPGMAFGLEFGGGYGKIFLSVFRIVMVIFLSFYMRILLRQKVNFGLLVSFGLVLAGALGNIIDSAVYGMIFSESGPFPSHDPAYITAFGEGYAQDKPLNGFLFGKVVDMLYFPLFSGSFPSWFPIWTGQEFQFFRPVFNIADSAISIGVLNLVLFQRKFFSNQPVKLEQSNSESQKASNQ